MQLDCPHCSQPLELDDDMAGQTVTCPACKRKFEVEADAPTEPPPIAITSGTKDCPFCGEQIQAKAKKCKHCGEFLDGSMRPAQAGAPAPSGPEKVICEGHVSHLYFLAEHIIGIVLWVALVGFIINLVCYLRAESAKYKLTSKRLFSESGILAKRSVEIAIKDIRSINFRQSLAERIFGLGTVDIGTAGTAGIEVSLVGIKRAQWVKDQIATLKNALG